MPRVAPLEHVVAVAIAALIGCGDEPRAVEWRCEAGAGVASSEVVRIEASVQRDGCASTDVVFTTDFGASEAGARPPVLEPGSYGLSCRLIDSSCRSIAVGCRDVTIPLDDRVDLTVTATATTPGDCEGLCVDGVCTGGAPDGGPGDAGVTDAGADAGVDAGPAVPTPVIDIAPAGTSNALPAVVWTGSEFVVGLLVADRSGVHVRVLRLPPGEARAGPLEVIDDGGAVSRQDVSLASVGDSLAVGWSEPGSSGQPALAARILPLESTSSIRYEPIVRSEFHDVQLFVTDDELFAAVRTFGSASGTEALVAGTIGAGMLASPEMVLEGALGDILVRSTTRGPIAVLGSIPALATRTGSGWETVTIAGLNAPLEGDAVELPDGALLSAWLHHTAEGAREIVAIRLELLAGGWTARSEPVPIPTLDSDPVLGLAGSHVLVAANRVLGAGTRQLALTWVDSTGSVAAGPCLVPPVGEYSNDPDIACADGWCAIAWIEGSTASATDFVTRVVQVPADPAAPCP